MNAQSLSELINRSELHDPLVAEALQSLSDQVKKERQTNADLSRLSASYLGENKQLSEKLEIAQEALTGSTGAIDFFDKICAATVTQRIAARTDHYDWLINSARTCKTALKKMRTI